MISIQLDNRADIDVKDNHINRPLHRATFPGQYPAIRLILKKRTDPEQRDGGDDRAVAYTVASEDDSQVVMQV